MVDFHHSTTARPATEEALLSMLVSDHNVMDAEFIRTYRSIDFPGYKLLQRQEVEAKNKSATRLRMIPTPKKAGDEQLQFSLGKCFDDIYGFRPHDIRCFYLSPWEFLMHWELVYRQKV